MASFHRTNPQLQIDYQPVPEKVNEYREYSDDDQSISDDLLVGRDLRGWRDSRSRLIRWWRFLSFHLLVLCLYLGVLVATYREGLRVGGIRGPRIIYSESILRDFMEVPRYV
jgi:hypothetical protein